MAKRTRYVVVAGLLLALVLAGFVSYYASGAPDGLNRVASDKNIDKTEEDHALKDGPLAGYSARGVGNDRLAGGLAGVAGVGLTLLISSGIVLAVRRRTRESASAAHRPDRSLTGAGTGP